MPFSATKLIKKQWYDNVQSTFVDPPRDIKVSINIVY